MIIIRLYPPDGFFDGRLGHIRQDVGTPGRPLN